MEKMESRPKRQNLLKLALKSKAAIVGYSIFMAACTAIALLSSVALWTQKDFLVLEIARKISPFTNLAVCLSTLFVVAEAKNALKSKTGQSDAQQQVGDDKPSEIMQSCDLNHPHIQ